MRRAGPTTGPARPPWCPPGTAVAGCTHDRDPAARGAYDGITAVVSGLDDADLQRPTRCRGWLVADLLFHVLCDAQRALVALASPAEGPADVDDVSYWRAFAGGSSDATRVAVATMDGLLSDDAVRPAGWNDPEYLLKATGRLPLSDRDRRDLGEAAGWFPLLG
ncbi:maleylpyruvate isomerase N-terminal domain-containing protein [Micromonospora yasonensis]|uniref:maleylpyruvate isomerase N-terminal domain-containing protein n=1 Tax=Micromonospora yasonensis TaxID=1128667 RepID=UPI00223059BE|nr:maleylpyruvate isomerase N-terminal domain-containing protein [Micromonospora yasonensis]MCW3840297.1 maleylpyruvate isomerase N-terminal domain-containing protein [Micromonospora yasonensis]